VQQKPPMIGINTNLIEEGWTPDES
jgi:hypothetical protein